MKKLLLAGLFTAAFATPPLPFIPYGATAVQTTQIIIDTTGASSLIHDSLLTFADGTRDINVDEAIIQTGDVTVRFRAGDLGGGQYVQETDPTFPAQFNVNPQAITHLYGPTHIRDIGGNQFAVDIDTGLFEVAASITPDFLGGLNVAGIITGNSGTKIGEIDDTTWAFTIESGDPFFARFNENILVSVDGAFEAGKTGSSHVLNVSPSGLNTALSASVTLDGPTIIGSNSNGDHTVSIDSSIFEVQNYVTPDFYGGLNVHGTLSVGEVDGSQTVSYIGGNDTFGDSLTGSFVWVTNLSAANLIISAAQHQLGETTTNTVVALTPYYDNAALGTVRLDGEYVQVSSLATGSTKFACFDNNGGFFASATVCVP